MEGNRHCDDGGGDRSIHSRETPERTEIDTTVLPSASEVFSLQDIQQALTAAWDGQNDDIPLVQAVHHYMPGLRQVIPMRERNADLVAENKLLQSEATEARLERDTMAEKNRNLEGENKRLKNEATDAILGKYTAGLYETLPQTAITHLQNQREELEAKLKIVESARSVAEEANKEKDRKIKTLLARLDSPVDAVSGGPLVGSDSPSKSKSPIKSEKKKGKRRAKDDTAELEQDTFGDMFGDQPPSAGDAPTSPVADDASLAVDSNKTTPMKDKVTSQKGTEAEKPGTGNEEAGSSNVASTQTSATPNSKKKLTVGNQDTKKTVEKLSNAAKEISEKIALLEKQKKYLQKQQKETDDRGSKAELGKKIGQLGKDIKTLQKQQKETEDQSLKAEQSKETAATEELSQVQLGQEIADSGPVEGATDGDMRDVGKVDNDRIEKVEDDGAAEPGGQEEYPVVSENGEETEIGGNSGNKKHSKQDLDKQLTECRKNVSQLKAQTATLEAEIATLKANLSTDKNDAKNIGSEAAELARLKKELQACKDENEHRKSEIEILQAQIVVDDPMDLGLRLRIEDLEEENSNLQADYTRKEQEYIRKEQELKSKQELAIHQLEENLKSQAQELHQKRLNEWILTHYDPIARDAKKKLGMIEKLEEQKRELEKQLTAEQKRIYDLERERELLRADKDKHTKRIAFLNEENGYLTNRNAALTKENADLLRVTKKAAVVSSGTQTEDDTEQRLENCEQIRSALEVMNKELVGKNKDCEDRYTNLFKNNEQTVQDLEKCNEAILTATNQMLQVREEETKAREYLAASLNECRIKNDEDTKLYEALRTKNDKLTGKNKRLQQDSISHGLDMDELEKELQQCKDAHKALKKKNDRLAEDNADLKRAAEIPLVVSMGPQTGAKDLDDAAEDHVEPHEDNAEELVRRRAENEAHELRIASLTAELGQAQITIARHEAYLEDEDGAVYTKDELNEIAITHSAILKTNAKDMAQCITENKALKKRIFKLEAELYQAQQSAGSCEESTAQPGDTEARNGDAAESEVQQKEAEAGNDLYGATSPDSNDIEIEAFQNTNADLQSRLADCEEHARTLESQVDHLKNQLEAAEAVKSKEEKPDLDERIANLEAQLRESRTEVASLKNRISDNAAEMEKRMEELASVREAPEEDSEALKNLTLALEKEIAKGEELQTRIDTLEGTNASGRSSPDSETWPTSEGFIDEATTLENENEKLKAQVVKLEAQATINSSGATMATLSGNLVDCNANVLELKRQVEHLEADLAKLIGQNKDLEAKLNECESEAEELKGSIKKREEDIDEISHDNTDLVRRLAYSERGVGTTTAQKAFELSVEVEVARRLTAKPTLISELSSRIQGIKEAHAEVIKSIQENESSNNAILKSINDYQNKLDALEVYLESGPRYTNGRAPDQGTNAVDQPAKLAEMTARLQDASETIMRLHRQVNDLREQNRRLGQDTIGTEREQDSLNRANNQEIATLQPPLDEAMEDLDMGQRTHTQFQHDDLEACQNERAALQEQVDELRKQRSERRREIRFTYRKALQNLKMYKELQSQVQALNGVGDEDKNKEIKRLQGHNETFYEAVSDRDESIRVLKEELEQAQELIVAGNNRINQLQRELEDLRKQKNYDDEELNAFRSQALANLPKLEQMEADRLATEEQCNNEKQALSVQIAEKDEEISKLGQNNAEDLSGDLARCNEERERLRNQLADATTALEQCQRKKQQLQSATNETPQEVPEDHSDELARCNEERDQLRIELLQNELANARAELDHCRQEHQRLVTELARVNNQLQRAHGNDNLQNQPADPNNPDVPNTPNDDLARYRAENRRLTEELDVANQQIEAIRQAGDALDPRAELAHLAADLAFGDARVRRLENELATAQTNYADARAALWPPSQALQQRTADLVARNADLRARDEAIAQLRADLQAAQADWLDEHNLNTSLEERLGGLLREIFRLLHEHVGVAAPNIDLPFRLHDMEPWLRELAPRLGAQARPAQDERPFQGAPLAVANVPDRAGGMGLGTRFYSMLPGGSSPCPACEALTAAAGNLDQTYLVRRTDFDEMRAQANGIVWGLEDRVRGLEDLVGR